MSWQGIHGHEEPLELFRRSLERARLASTYLFVGTEGIGKRSFAVELARALLCLARPASALDPCGACTSCKLVAASTHPDLLRVGKPADRAFIPLEVFIGKDERRMQEGLCHDLALRPFLGGRRIAILDDADYLNEEGANCLLKTLEEPPPHSLLILICTSLERQLATIRSRSQIVRFRALSLECLTRVLLEKNLAENEPRARAMAADAQGSVARAVELADPELQTFRAEFLAQLASPRLDGLALAKMVSAQVDEAGKEAAPRRARARWIVDLAIEFHRQWLRALSGCGIAGDEPMRQALESMLKESTANVDLVSDCLDRSLEARTHIDRNANQTTWIEAWFDELGRRRENSALSLAALVRT